MKMDPGNTAGDAPAGDQAGGWKEIGKGEAVMATQVGKRYICKKCGAEYIGTRPGNGEVKCCGEPVELKK
jgi:hypothetical protein